MDYEADKNMQNVLREELRMTGGRTLVTIAHRLSTIMDYDAIIVMEASRVIEYGYCFLSFAIHVIRSDEYWQMAFRYGSPRDLYNSRGRFYDMIYHSKDMEQLQKLLVPRHDEVNAQVRAAS